MTNIGEEKYYNGEMYLRTMGEMIMSAEELGLEPTEVHEVHLQMQNNFNF